MAFTSFDGAVAVAGAPLGVAAVPPVVALAAAGVAGSGALPPQPVTRHAAADTASTAKAVIRRRERFEPMLLLLTRSTRLAWARGVADRDRPGGPAPGCRQLTVLMAVRK